MSRITLSDGCEIEYDLKGPETGPWVVLLHGEEKLKRFHSTLAPRRRRRLGSRSHRLRCVCVRNRSTHRSSKLHTQTHPPSHRKKGWSGSRRYFDLNAPALAAAGCRVLAPDLRHHGGSSKTRHGRHVSRLAADLDELLRALNVEGATVVGTSMGCAVIWSYFELFGLSGGRDRAAVAKAVFVDQAPLQNRAPGWDLGSKGCHDEASLGRLKEALSRGGAAEIADGNAAGCLSLPVPADVAALLRAETLRCDPGALAELMTDHTQLDWRELLPRLEGVPCLNCCGAQSGVFPLEGCMEVSNRAPDCRTVVFDRANHWLYLEQPGEFNAAVLAFVRGEGGPSGGVAHVP